MEELLKANIKKLTKEEALELETTRFSYSKLDLLDQCGYRYKLKYIDENFSQKKTLPLEFGSLLHRVLEEKCNFVLQDQPVDYEVLQHILHKGIQSEKLLGTTELSDKYSTDYLAPDNATQANYDDKVHIFENSVLYSRMSTEEKEWKPICAELPFFFLYKGVILHGFIDRIDQNSEGQLKVIDYKTSKKVFPPSKLKTPLQMFIYDLACYALYEKIPVAHEYDFICLDQQITEEDGVCTSGYFKRGLKKLDHLLEYESQMCKENKFVPTPTPLCYWCEFAGHTPNADIMLPKRCDYYSLWSPEFKTFKVNKRYDEKQDIAPNRKFIF